MFAFVKRWAVVLAAGFGTRLRPLTHGFLDILSISQE